MNFETENSDFNQIDSISENINIEHEQLNSNQSESNQIDSSISKTTNFKHGQIYSNQSESSTKPVNSEVVNTYLNQIDSSINETINVQNGKLNSKQFEFSTSKTVNFEHKKLNSNKIEILQSIIVKNADFPSNSHKIQKHQIETIIFNEYNEPSTTFNENENDPLEIISNTKLNNHEYQHIQKILTQDLKCNICYKARANIVFFPCRDVSCNVCWQTYREDNKLAFEQETKSKRLLNNKMKNLKCIHQNCNQIAEKFVEYNKHL